MYLPKFGFLVLDERSMPELRFSIREGDERFRWFSWTDASQTSWQYRKPDGFEGVFAVGDSVYDADCPILGVFDLKNEEHLQQLVCRSWNQQMVTEDLHRYP